MHKRLVANIVARNLLIVCFAMLWPLAWALKDNWQSAEAKAFEATMTIGTLSAILFLWLFRTRQEQMEKFNTKDGLAVVGLSWIILPFFGALPLFLSKVVPSYTDALFEITSGFTTTGSSILADIEILPRGILFWRSLTQWLGGMGLIVLYIAFLPPLGGTTTQLFKAEGTGVKVDKLEPRIKQIAKHLWMVYFLLTVAQTALLMVGGMSLFDSLCHSFGTIATGGFSTKNASFANYSSYIQWVTVIFMFLGGTNFVLHFLALRGKFKPYFRDEEFRFYSAVIFSAVLVFTLILLMTGLSSSPFRDAAFQVVSIATTTGFVSSNYDVWPSALKFILIMLMIMGGCGGSTSGGMKVVRMLLNIRITLQSIFKTVYPHLVVPIRLNQKPLEESTIQSVSMFFVAYIQVIFIATVLLLFFEKCDIMTAFSAVCTTIGNTGPGLGKVGPMENFAWLSLSGKWLLTFTMLVGRLELYALLILFVPSTWRK